MHAVEDISVDAPIRIAYSELYATRGSPRRASRQEGFRRRWTGGRCRLKDPSRRRPDDGVRTRRATDPFVRATVRTPQMTCDAGRRSNPVADPDEGVGRRRERRVRDARAETHAVATIAHGVTRLLRAITRATRHQTRTSTRRGGTAYAAGEWTAPRTPRKTRRRGARDALGISPRRVATLLGNALTRLAEAEVGTRARVVGSCTFRRRRRREEVHYRAGRERNACDVTGGSGAEGAGNLVLRRPRGDDRRAREGNDGAPIPRPRD